MEATDPTGTVPLEALGRDAACLAVAGEIAELVRARPTAVLGLATGRTPIGVYAELARLVREEGLDLSRVRAFNLDEYRGIGPGDERSFHAFMRRHLWDHVNADLANVRIPSGTIADADVESHCAAYERAIAEAGGLDLQLLGLGRNGHIGFNEPGSPRDSRTRLVALDPITIADAAGDFGGAEHVPTHAITMGVATILDARRIRVLAFGESKREAVATMRTGDVDSACPATFLRGHADVRLYADAAALGRADR